MHGCKQPSLFVLVALLAGCTDTLPPEKRQEICPSTLGAAFDAAATGEIHGTANWQGDLPHVPPFKVLGLPGDYSFDVRQDQPNPNQPRIQSSTLAMENVLVFLRQVDLKRSRPWDHPLLRIEQHKRRLLLHEGEYSSNVGWARVGDKIEVTNRDDHFHVLRGRGAAFFSLPFPKPNVTARRVMDKAGIIELSSGAFFFWMHAYLHVTDHPYYARTDEWGHFVLENVPAGSYELVCWLPNWELAKKLRDPETGHIIEVDFRPPIEQVQTVAVGAGQRQEVNYLWSARNVAR